MPNNPEQIYARRGGPNAMPAVTEIVRELVACAFLETGMNALADIHLVKGVLPVGTPISVERGARKSLLDLLDSLMAVRDKGFEPVPHLAVRRVASRNDLCVFLRRAVRTAGVSRVHLVDGEAVIPAGPYTKATALLRDDLLPDCGLQQLGFVSYPECDASLPDAAPNGALSENCSLARHRGLNPYVVTRFTFVTNRIVRHCAELARSAAGVPVYAGLREPSGCCTLAAALQCRDVNVSLRAVETADMHHVPRMTHARTTEQLVALAHHVWTGSLTNVVGLHVHSFGGLVGSAAWINERLKDGSK